MKPPRREAPDLFKRRTRQHIIADLSRVHLEAVIIEAGCTAEVIRADYGYDLCVRTYDQDGYIEPNTVLIQLKATERIIPASSESIPVDVSRRDFELWRRELFPVFLVLFDAVQHKAFWLHVQEYFRSKMSRKPRKASRTIRVRIPCVNLVNQDFMSVLRNEKAKMMRILGVSNDGE